MNAIHYVPSENWDLLPFIITLCNSCPVSSCRQRKTDALHDKNVWKEGWLPFVPLFRGTEWGSLPHPSSGRKIAAGKPGASPSMEETSQNLAHLNYMKDNSKPNL